MQQQRRLVWFVFLCASAPAQWLNFPTPGIPRTPGGKPNLAAPTPRALDGKPDLSGVWMHETTSVAEVKRLFGNRLDADIALAPPGMEIGTQHKYAFNILVDFKPGEEPLRREAAERMRRFGASPANLCSEVAGFPLESLLSEPIKIVQSPRETVILAEVDNFHRQIYTDGRALPQDYSLPAYLGYSVGHWERDTLVVETAGFNDKTRLDLMGHPHSEALHVVERYRRPDFGRLEVEMTFDDPEMYTKPFTIHVGYDLMADADIFESFCNENEKDRAHLGHK